MDELLERRPDQNVDSDELIERVDIFRSTDHHDHSSHGNHFVPLSYHLFIYPFLPPLSIYLVMYVHLYLCRSH